MSKFLIGLSAAILTAGTLAISAVPAIAADTTIKVQLWDKGSDAEMTTDMGWGMADAKDVAKAPMGIKTSINTVPVGNVTFDVTNTSKDTIHEMIVMPIGDKTSVPYDATMETVNEDEAGDLGEVSELDPGATGSLTLPLKAGQYLLYCNVAGHFTSGMWTTIEVK